MTTKPKKKTKKKAAAKRKPAAKRKTSRGLRVGPLPFKALMYGKNLPAGLKELGIRGDRVPVLSWPRSAGGFGGVSIGVSGHPATSRGKTSKKGAGAEKALSVAERKRGIALKAMSALVAAAQGGSADKIAKAKAKQVAASEDFMRQVAYDRQIAAAMAGKSKKQAVAEAKAAAAAAGAAVGATPKAAKKAAAVVAKVVAVEGGGARAADAWVELDVGDATEDRRIAQMMASNPDLLFATKGKKGKKGRQVVLDMQPVKRGTAGAVSVFVAPTAFQYATLSVKSKSKVKKNGLYPMRKNMSKKRRSMKRNPLGADLAQLGKPVMGAGAGFVASRLINALALFGASKSNVAFFATPAGQALVRLATTSLGIVGTLTLGNKLDIIRNNRGSIVTGMALNAIEATVRTALRPMVLNPETSQYIRDLAVGDTMGLYDMSHAGAPYSPMMGEYVAQALNGSNGMGEYVAQALNGGLGTYAAEAAAGSMGEYVAQALNGEDVDPSNQEDVDNMINAAEQYAGLGTQVMAATAGLGTQVMAATAGFGTQVMSAAAGLYGFGDDQPMDRGIVTEEGIYNFFTDPVPDDLAGFASRAAGVAHGVRRRIPAGFASRAAGVARGIPAVSIAQAPMPVVPMGLMRASAVPIRESLNTPEGRGFAGGVFGRHLFGTMV